MELNSISLLVYFNNWNRLNKPSPITNLWWLLPLRLRFLLNTTDCLPFTILTSNLLYGTSAIKSSLDAFQYLTYSSLILIIVASCSMCHYQFTAAQSDLPKNAFLFKRQSFNLLCHMNRVGLLSFYTETVQFFSTQHVQINTPWRRTLKGLST